MQLIVQVVLCLSVLASVTLGKNQQTWSRYTYNDEAYSLKCKSDGYDPKPSDIITWSRHGASGELTSNGYYELRTVGGVPNMELYVKKVTDEQHGIYVCHVKDANLDLMDSVVMGINWGTRRYHDDIDKYRDQIIVGAIAAASIFVFIMAVGLVSHFRYLSEESLEKRRQRKEGRLSQGTNGLRNQAYDGEMTEGNVQSNGSNMVESSFIRF